MLSWLNRAGPFAIPRFIWVLLAIDAALGIVYLADYAIGHPVSLFAKFIDLDGERNLPTWYSSIQWFAVSALLFGVADRFAERLAPRSWLLYLLPRSSWRSRWMRSCNSTRRWATRLTPFYLARLGRPPSSM